MCGFAGYLGGASMREDEALDALRGMGGALGHRGPDSDGTWLDLDAGIGLAHRRLSILDLSDAGAQPMQSADGRYVLAYNGEVYNFAALRAELEAKGVPFRGHSDAEVVVQAIGAWGVDRTVPRLRGMFAFAVWDREERALHLVRDPVGVKPLYYGRAGERFVFGSELGALEGVPGFCAEVDRAAVASFLRYNFIPAPLSIYEGIRKQRPGTTLRVTRGSGGIQVEERRYWSLADVVRSGSSSRRNGKGGTTPESLESVLEASVGEQLVADVPVGAFLSSGVDSPLLVALAQRRLGRPIRTFTVGFDREEWDEAPAAAAIARHLGSDHAEVRVTEREVLDLVPGVPALFDEPFADASQIPTHLVARVARERVKVVLSGDGGDELFGGYRRYQEVPRAWRMAGVVPRRLRRSRVVRAAASSAPGLTLGRIVAPVGSRHLVSRDRVLKVLDMAAADSFDDFYDRFLSQWRDDLPVTAGAPETPVRDAVREAGTAGSLEPVERAMYADLLTYLPDDILTKVDRCTMGVSLEARVPYLAPDVIRSAWSLPREARVGGGGKRALREVLARHVPAELIPAGKRGFEVPLAAWLRGPLRDWAGDLLEEGRLRRQGLLDADSVGRHWREHQAGDRHWHHRLWGIVMLEAWLEGRRP